MATFGFAIVIVFLALAALFEKLADPLVILISYRCRSRGNDFHR